jgi:hypothetical protein
MNPKLFSFTLFVLGIESAGIAWCIVYGHTFGILLFAGFAALALRVAGSAFEGRHVR